VLASKGFYVRVHSALRCCGSYSTPYAITPGILELVRSNSMVSIRSCRRRDHLPRFNGHQRRHLQLPTCYQSPGRYQKHLCTLSSRVQWVNSLGDILVSLLLKLPSLLLTFDRRFTCEMKDQGAGLLAAIFIGIAPGYISRSVAGSYDNEAIAIFLLMFTFYLWIRALKDGSAFFGTMAGIFYFYMVAAWGESCPGNLICSGLTFL